MKSKMNLSNIAQKKVKVSRVSEKEEGKNGTLRRTFFTNILSSMLKKKKKDITFKIVHYTYNKQHYRNGRERSFFFFKLLDGRRNTSSKQTSPIDRTVWNA